MEPSLDPLPRRRLIMHPQARAVHVHIAALHDRFENGGDKPLMIVREKDAQGRWTRCRLFEEIRFAAGAQLKECEPMPGSKGRGIAVCFTYGRLEGFHRAGPSGPEYFTLDDEDRDPYAEFRPWVKAMEAIVGRMQRGDDR